MKKAFTLAETLITMGIIGIVAALTLPAVNQMRPDETKIKYLKAFDALQESVIEIASNKLEYPTHEENAGNVTRVYDSPTHPAPLMNISESSTQIDSSNVFISLSSRNNWNNNSKLCHLVAWEMSGNNEKCSSNLLQLDVPTNNLGEVAFTTPNGIDWYMRVSRFKPSVVSNDAVFAENVMIDVNRNDGPNCLYNADNCRYPDRFWFMITADGKVTPADPMGKAYIQTRKTNGRRDMTDYINTNTLEYSQWVQQKDPTDNPNQVVYKTDISPLP